MKDLLVKVIVAGLFVVAIYQGSLPVLASTAGIAIAFFVSHNAGVGTQMMMVIVGALAGGLGGEIGRTFWLHAESAEVVGSGPYLDTMLVSLMCTASVWLAIFSDRLLARLASKGD